MLLSIIVPIYNAEKYVSRCLDSLLNQNLPHADYEILVMDDGSSDCSYSILQEYAAINSCIRLFQQENKGACSARNALMQEVRGEYVYFFDADDLMAFSALGPLVRQAKRQSLDIIGFDTVVTSNSDSFDQNVPITIPVEPEVVNGYKYLERNPEVRVEIWWYLVRTSFLTENNMTFDQNEFNGDVLFTLNILGSAERMVHVPITIHCYFQSELSIMRNKDLTHRRILIDDLHGMIHDFSHFITRLEHKKIPNSKSLIQILEKRKNIFVVFFLAKLIRSDISSNKARVYLQQLRAIGAYPLSSYQLTGFSPFKKIAVKMVLNREYLLLPTIDLTTFQYNLRNSA